MRRCGAVGGAVVAVGTLLVGLAGCTADDAPAGPAASPAATAAAMAVWRDFTGCVRDRGGPALADPTFEADGKLAFPPGADAALAAAPPAAAECQTVLARLPAHAQGGAQPAGDVAALTAFARCMRGKGVPDFPDPRPDGRFPIAGTSVEGGKTPALARALAACRQENPDPKGGFVGAQ